MTGNKLLLWSDLTLYLGNSFEPVMHSHNAVQCCISLGGEFNIQWQHQTNNGNQWHSCHAAIISANLAHKISNPNGPLCILFLEKTSSYYRSIVDYHCLQQECDIKKQPLLLDELKNNETSDRLIELSAHIQNDDFNSASYRQLNHLNILRLKNLSLKVFNPHIKTRRTTDNRIEKLLIFLEHNINLHPEKLLEGNLLANQINLSESRMQHLFKQTVGIPLRRYYLWMRLKVVVKLVLQGRSLTNAAYEAGFSDSAHFSRTFKSMYGIKPSSLLTAKGNLQTLILE